MHTRASVRAEGRSFHEQLYEWMERAPWLALSAAAHALLYLLLSAIPWGRLQREAPREITAQVARPPEPLFEDPPPPPEALVLAPLEEPVIQNAELPIEAETPASETLASPAIDWTTPEDFRVPVLGTGGGPPGSLGGKMRGRFGRGAGRSGSGRQRALREALDWLAAHQSENGSWDCDGFMASCGKIGSTTCEGPGNATHDVGVTALALLAFLGDGNTTSQGEYKEVVQRGIAWLEDQQDPDSGLFGEKSSHDFIYDHALATLAMCEAYYFSRSPLIKRPVQKAVELILRARNPYSAWRYEIPPVGDSDTSVTGWMVFALSSAKEAGIEVDYESAFEGALSFLDEVSDPASGRIGYSNLGELSSRTPANEHYPREKGEAMTAVGLLARVFLGQRPEETPIMKKHADLIVGKKPVWDPEGLGNDMYSWYYGTYALYQMGRPWWPEWEKALEGAVVDSQRRDGDAKGSWDPIGPWGFSGGRVYSTAVMTLTLEVYFRYARVLGAR